LVKEFQCWNVSEERVEREVRGKEGQVDILCMKMDRSLVVREAMVSGVVSQ
jgi:hypothetical protein